MSNMAQVDDTDELDKTELVDDSQFLQKFEEESIREDKQGTPLRRKPEENGSSPNQKSKEKEKDKSSVKVDETKKANDSSVERGWPKVDLRVALVMAVLMGLFAFNIRFGSGKIW